MLRESELMQLLEGAGQHPDAMMKQMQAEIHKAMQQADQHKQIKAKLTATPGHIQHELQKIDAILKTAPVKPPSMIQTPPTTSFGTLGSPGGSPNGGLAMGSPGGYASRIGKF